jgi:hypothetical protein
MHPANAFKSCIMAWLRSRSEADGCGEVGDQRLPHKIAPGLAQLAGHAQAADRDSQSKTPGQVARSYPGQLSPARPTCRTSSSTRAPRRGGRQSHFRAAPCLLCMETHQRTMTGARGNGGAGRGLSAPSAAGSPAAGRPAASANSSSRPAQEDGGIKGEGRI